MPPSAPVTVPNNFPSLSEIERMSPDEIDVLFGLKPKFDIPASARRALREVGVVGVTEGGFAPHSLAGQPGELVRAAIEGTHGPLVSRWGHILLRRALASRLDAPDDMDPVAFAAMRASLLNRLGEGIIARAVVQDVDTANYNGALTAAAFDAYVSTGDLLGLCPVVQLKPDVLKGGGWDLSKSICHAYSGRSREAERELDRALNRGTAPRIDVLLAQRFAGAAGARRRAVTIEWTGVDALNPWRFSLARALGVEVPASLRTGAPLHYDAVDVQVPAVPLTARAAAAERAGGRGLLSSAAMVDLYSQLYADPTIDNADKGRAVTLRNAYLGRDAAARLAALRSLWGEGDGNYGGQVLTAAAAARLPVTKSLLEEAPRIVASMLSAGLDRNAVRWGRIVPEGSAAWGMLVMAQSNRSVAVDSGAVGDYLDQDESVGQRKSSFLIAGLAGLGRINAATANDFASDLGFSLASETGWTRKIDRAAQLGNPTLVALLAGLGMQGETWDKMTARHLFHIVRALNQVGLNAEARMIAAEAVARG